MSNYDGKIVVVSPNTETFQPNLEELEQKITARTKAVIINSPNNPTGVVYSEDTIKKMADILRSREKELGTDTVSYTYLDVYKRQELPIWYSRT